MCFKTQHCLRAAKVAALQNASIPQFQCISCCDCHKQKTQGGCANKTSETLHGDFPSRHDGEVIRAPSHLIIENA
jgi:hypothetical protein